MRTTSLPLVANFDREVFRRITTKRTPVLDATMPTLTNAANHSKIWLATGVLLAGAGGRRGRRAALRGALAIGLSSALTNGLAKNLLRRRRPQPLLFPWTEGRVRLPTSSSMPSGHTASAFAFATATALEFPAAAVPVGLLAGAIGYSRVHTGVHYPGDVLAGAAIGVAVGLSTRLIMAPAASEVAEAPPAYSHLAAEPSEDGAGLIVIINPSAGSVLGPDPESVIRRELPGAEIRVIGEDDDFDDLLAAAGRDGRAIGIVGGDGSVNAAAKVALELDKPLVVFPGGTLNHFARTLGLDTIEAAAAAVRDGQLVAVDVGEIDGEPFLNTASFGSYATLVDRREELEDTIGKWPAMFVALVKVLIDAEPERVLIDGEEHRIWMIFIGNSEYEPAGLMPARRPRLDDDLLDVRLVDGTNPWARLRLIAAALTGDVTRSTAYDRRLVHTIEIDSPDGPMRLARDGETFDGSSRFAISKHPRPLKVYGGADPAS